jgi:translation initiation factor 1
MDNSAVIIAETQTFFNNWIWSFLMCARIVYSTDPAPSKHCPRCGRTPCVCKQTNLPPRQQTAYVKRDRKRRRGKTVTVIYGLQHTDATYKALLKTLKSFCGAGGTLKNGELEVQGDHREKVGEKLTALGYKVKFSGG